MTCETSSTWVWARHTICPTPTTSGGREGAGRGGVGPSAPRGSCWPSSCWLSSSQAWWPEPVGDVQPIDVPTPGEESVPLRVGQLEPGSYEADAWTPRIVLTPTDDTWRVIELDSDWLSLVRGPDSLEIARWPSVVDPSAPGWGPDAVMSAPADLAAWLVDHPRLTTTRQATSLGGLPAVRITARTLTTLDSGPPDCRGRPCVPLARAGSSTAFLTLAVGEVATFYVIGDVGDQFVISYAAPTDRYGVLEAGAEQLLGSLRFVEE